MAHTANVGLNIEALAKHFIAEATSMLLPDDSQDPGENDEKPFRSDDNHDTTIPQRRQPRHHHHNHLHHHHNTEEHGAHNTKELVDLLGAKIESKHDEDDEPRAPLVTFRQKTLSSWTPLGDTKPGNEKKKR
jgi:hypothetical protein